LDQSAALQSKFDRWAGNWFGVKKRAALKEAATEIEQRNQQEYSKVREVYQNERYDAITRAWKKSGLVLCNNPTISMDDLFDPYSQSHINTGNWIVDFNMTSIDAEGWTYGFDFATLNKTICGENAPKWNSYVRRRKWKYIEKKSKSSAAVEELVFFIHFYNAYIYHHYYFL
jgi:hypothetical protein